MNDVAHYTCGMETSLPISTYTVEDAASKLSVTPHWYLKRLRSHELPGRKMGRKWVLTEQDLQAALDRYFSPAVSTPNPWGMSDRSRLRRSRPKSLGGIR